MKACVLIRDLPPYRRKSFVNGLKALGYDVSNKIDPSPDNVLVIWNRYTSTDHVAKQYEVVNGKVIVAENGYLGREWRGQHWYSLALNRHNGAGQWNVGSPSRWDDLNVPLLPWRQDGKEIVVLATRHIGVKGVAEPVGWSLSVAQKLRDKLHMPVRVRMHPGENISKFKPLQEDLKDAEFVVSWGSGAALKALAWGIPSVHGMKNWIGAYASNFIDQVLNGLKPDNDERLGMFRNLAWAMWTTDEIVTGEPFKWLLK